MKIDKISDNQIRCILDKEDLSGRGIAPSELAYGSDKARELFIEMLGIAEKKFGFEPDDSPLMVEAIPSANGSLILLISKSEDPQDLDTRFSRFSPETPAAPLEEEEPTDAEDTEEIDVGDPVIEENDISNLTNKPLPFDDATIGSAIQSLLGIDDLGFKTKPEPKPDFTALPKFLTPDKKIPSEKADVSALKIYSFDSFDALQEAAHALADVFHGENAVYRDPDKSRYFLVLKKGSGEKDSFSKAVSILYEYSRPLRCNYATIAYIKEHLEPIIKENAIAILNVL